ncbi:hypothetical protein IAU60_004880 [Kwoniella sp. DSM 27419]
MSRAATATPPPQAYFPQRTSTPTMRHASSPNVTAAHFSNRNGYQHQPGKRRTKNMPQSGANASNVTTPLVASWPASADEDLGLSFEDLGGRSDVRMEAESAAPSRQSSIRSYASSASIDSFHTTRTDFFTDEPAPMDEAPGHVRSDADSRLAMDRAALGLPPSVSSSISRPSTQLITPLTSAAPSPAREDDDCVTFDSAYNPLPINIIHSPPKSSWVGKVAMAVVNTGMSIGLPFVQHAVEKAKPVVAPSPPASTTVQESNSAGSLRLPQPVTLPPLTQGELNRLSPEEAQARRRELVDAENRRVTECARLCSQWPQSGYNMTKFGPNGAAVAYSPQSFSNPGHVAKVMQRQAELERHIALTSTLFYSCRERDRRGDVSEDETAPSSIGSDQSSQPSPTTSISLSSEDALAAAIHEQKTAADIKSAMGSPLVTLDSLPTVSDSQGSLQLTGMCLSPRSVKAARSLPDLDALASAISLTRDDAAMDVDHSDTGSLASSAELVDPRPVTRQGRAQSCGAKRPLTVQANEEDKRRKVDEAMVVEEAVETGVIMPGHSVKSPSSGRMSSSVPELGKAKQATPPAVFGHVVKTSDTHPIIISPFFPADLLPVIARHLVMPPMNGPSAHAPLLLSSTIDVPSLLLSYVAPPPGSTANSAPSSPPWFYPKNHRPASPAKTIGNLLLSSCPGKRLRLDGPSRGRGPVCRDIATDLRRIKSEGVGCLVCCLDDTELALLGVPWETYRKVAAETGLDVLRLPMPDGFTPVSLALFDSQVTLIATKYSLQGTNVLVHCRGGVGRAGLTACAWAIKMGYVQPHPSLQLIEASSHRQNGVKAPLPAELEHQIVMSIVERVIAMIRSRRGLKAIESFEQVQFLAKYVGWLREGVRQGRA